jgi:hypothetical protein
MPLPNSNVYCRYAARIISCLLVLTSQNVFAGSGLPQGQGSGLGATTHPLSREDNQRSQFAGAKMDRLQSFDRPSEVQKNASAHAPRPAEGQTNSGVQKDLKRGSTKEEFAWKKETSIPSRVYKNVPLNAVYLNGENIVGLRNQTLEGVNVRFDAAGNIYIDAPHYEIHRDSTFHPLLPDETPQYSKDVDSIPARPAPRLSPETGSK